MATRKSRPLADAKSGRNYCLWLLGERIQPVGVTHQTTPSGTDETTALAIVEQLAKDGFQSDQRCVEAVKRSAERREAGVNSASYKNLEPQGIETSLISSEELLDSDDENKRSEKLYKNWIAKTDGSPKAKRKVLSRIARRGFPIGHLF